MSTRELVFQYKSSGARKAAAADRRVRESVQKTGRVANREAGAVERWLERNKRAIQVVAAASLAAVGAILSASPTMRAQLSGVRSAFTLFAEQITRDLLPAGTNLGSMAIDLAQRFSDLPSPIRKAIGILGAVGAAVAVILPVLSLLISSFGTVAAAVAPVISAMSGAIAAIKTAIAVIGLIAGVSATTVAAIGVLIAAVGALAIAFITDFRGVRTKSLAYLSELLTGGRKRLVALAGVARDKARDARDGVVRFIGKLRSRALDLLSLGRELTEKGKQWVQGLVSGVRQRASALADAFRSMAGRVARAFKNRFNELIPSSISIPSVTVDIPDILGGGSRRVGGGALSLPQLNTGGRITGSGLAMLHEGERVMPAAQVRDRGRQPAGNGDVNIERVVIQVVDSGDPQRTGRDIGREFEKALESRGA